MEQLHRNLGKLHTARNKLDEALRELSRDIYFSSSEVGPEHINTSGGYFLVANIFYTQRKVNFTSPELDGTEKDATGRCIVGDLIHCGHRTVYFANATANQSVKNPSIEKKNVIPRRVGLTKLYNIAGRELASVLRQSSRHLV